MQASIPGVGVVRREGSAIDGIDRLRKAGLVGFEVSHPLKLEMQAPPIHQNSYNWRSKGRQEVMRKGF